VRLQRHGQSRPDCRGERDNCIYLLSISGPCLASSYTSMHVHAYICIYTHTHANESERERRSERARGARVRERALPLYVEMEILSGASLFIQKRSCGVACRLFQSTRLRRKSVGNGPEAMPARRAPKRNTDAMRMPASAPLVLTQALMCMQRQANFPIPRPCRQHLLATPPGSTRTTASTLTPMHQGLHARMCPARLKHTSVTVTRKVLHEETGPRRGSL